MKTNNHSLVGSLVKFYGVKTYQPGAGKKVLHYGYVTSHIRGGYFGVKYSFVDGEYGESMIHASDLELCEEKSDILMAKRSALGWCRRIGAECDLLERAAKFAEDGDMMSAENIMTKYEEKSFILGHSNI